MAGEEIRDLQLMPGNKGLLAATGDCRILLFHPEVSSLALDGCELVCDFENSRLGLFKLAFLGLPSILKRD